MISFSRARIVLATLLTLSLGFAPALLAEQVKGKITSISKKAQIIQLKVGNEKRALAFSKSTQWVNAKSIKDLIVNDTIIAEVDGDKPASKITRKMITLPKGWEIGLKELQQRLAKGGVVLVDSRPGKRYNEGHIPGSISIFANQLVKDASLLPAAKSTYLIFYCGGPTCGLSPKSAKFADKKGYKNVRVFKDGMPAWKKAGLPVAVKGAWLSKNLGNHLVILDARAAAAQKSGHIKGAVNLGPREMAQMDKEFAAKKLPGSKWMLPGVADKTALVIAYADKFNDKEAQYAFRYLKRWGYKNAAILEGGFSGWKAKGYPTQTGVASAKIDYVKKLAKGAISPKDFRAAIKAGATVLDVREPGEVTSGKITGAKHIPLSQLENKLSSLKPDQKIVIHCTTGVRAEMAYDLLKKKGFKKVQFLNEVVEVKPDGSFTVG